MYNEVNNENNILKNIRLKLGLRESYNWSNQHQLSKKHVSVSQWNDTR